jgi:hypothetical protein
VRLAEPLDYAAALASVIAAGRVAVPLDPGAPEADTERSVAIAGTAAMITPGLDFDLLDEGAAATASPPVVGDIFLSISGATGLRRASCSARSS